MKIVGGPNSLELARKISESLNLPLAPANFKRFPDGEFYFRFDENLAEEDLLVVQSLYPPQDKHLLELFIILHTARDLKAKSIKVFIPYLAYSRQNQRYLDGECLSSAMVAEMIERLGVNALYTVDIHNRMVLTRYNIPAFNLMASGELAKYFATKDLHDPLIISPDDEETAIDRVKYAADIIKMDYDFFKKSRDRHTGEVTTYRKRMDVYGRDVIIIDDIISTGKTSANAARLLKKQGARKIFVGVSHALLHIGALELLKDAGVEEVIGTDSVVNEFAKVSVAPLLVGALKQDILKF